MWYAFARARAGPARHCVIASWSPRGLCPGPGGKDPDGGRISEAPATGDGLSSRQPSQISALTNISSAGGHYIRYRSIICSNTRALLQAVQMYGQEPPARPYLIQGRRGTISIRRRLIAASAAIRTRVSMRAHSACDPTGPTGRPRPIQVKATPSGHVALYPASFVF